MNLAPTTPGTKTIAAKFLTNATENLVCCRCGTIFSIIQNLSFVGQLDLKIPSAVKQACNLCNTKSSASDEDTRRREHLPQGKELSTRGEGF